MYTVKDNKAILGLSPDLSRPERVSFVGKLKNPLPFRDAMLVLREIVISDARKKTKKREEFFTWLTQEVNRRAILHNEFLGKERDQLSKEFVGIFDEIQKKQEKLKSLRKRQHELSTALEKYNVWYDYNRLYSQFNEFLRTRDIQLYYALDPVISVHPDIVCFEAFSKDESIYGNLSVDRTEFDITGTPQLGTTNIDFSAKLGKEIERFRSYNELELAVNPEGFAVETGVTAKHVEKKIDLPESWVKGFNQVSTAAGLSGIEVNLSPADFYAICTFLRRHRARKSPRATIWTLDPGKPIKILFQPWNTEITLASVYKGASKQVEKIWGSRRWLVLERLVPIANGFKLKILGFGMPMFVIADIGGLKMTIGFSSWSSNDWARGTAFNIMAGFLNQGDAAVGEALKRERAMSFEQLSKQFNSLSSAQVQAGVGMLMRRGEAYFDLAQGRYFYRRLSAIPLPESLWAPNQLELSVVKLLADIENRPSIARFEFVMDGEGMLHASLYMGEETTKGFPAPRTGKYSTGGTANQPKVEAHVLLNNDGQVEKVKCSCREFQEGERNISEPCQHLLVLFVKARDHANLPPVIGLKVDDVFSEQKKAKVTGPKAKPKKARRRRDEDEDEDSDDGEDDDDSDDEGDED